MTRRDPFIDLVEDFLDVYEGPADLPDSLRDAVLADLSETRQSGPFGLQRYPHVNSSFSSPAPYALFAAAVLIGVAVLAFNLLPLTPTDIGTDETPMPAVPGSPSPVSIQTHPPVAALPTAGTVVARYDVGAAGHPVLYAHGSVWLSNQETGRLTRMDPSSGELTGSVEVNPDPENTRYDLNAVADDRWVFATGVDGTVVRIDPQSNEVVERIDIGTLVYRMATFDGDVFITDLDQGDHVIRLDPDTGDVLWDMRYPVWPAGLAVTDEAVWVAPYRAGELLALDPETGELIDRFPASIYGMQVALHGESLYITGNQERPVERFSLAESRVVARIAELATVLSDGARLFGLRWDGIFFELDPATLQPIGALEIPGGETASAVVGDGAIFVASGADVVVIDHAP